MATCLPLTSSACLGAHSTLKRHFAPCSSSFYSSLSEATPTALPESSITIAALLVALLAAGTGMPLAVGLLLAIFKLHAH